MSAAVDRKALERRAAAALELKRRKRVRINADKTVYGIYEPTGEYGGRLVRCWQEHNGQYVEVDKEPVVKMPLKLEKFLITPKRFKVAFGGRGAAKSVTFSNIFVSEAKDYGKKTLCLRELQNSIEDSVHAALKGQIEQLGFDGFDVTDKAIRLGNEEVFKFRGLAKNPDAVKSAHGFLKAWTEEAQSLSESSLEMLTPTLRIAGSELWFSLNPMSSADPMSQRFIEPFMAQLLRDGIYEDDLHLIVWINYTDNPWHSELEQERLYALDNYSTAKYRHVWLGYSNDEVENSIITVDWFDAAIDAHTKLGFKAEGAKVAAFDPADQGGDAKGYVLRHGSIVLDVADTEKGDVNEGCDWALDRAINAQADHFVWDAGGLGVSLKRQVDTALKGKQMAYVLFNGAESPENPKAQFINTQSQEGQEQMKTNQEALKNRRAQYYTRLRDRFYATYRAVVKGEYIDPDEMISLSSDIEDINGLRAEVCRVPTKPNGNGKIQIMTKEEMLKLKIKSPNRADALMMATYIPPVKRRDDRPISIPRRKRI